MKEYDECIEEDKKKKFNERRRKKEKIIVHWINKELAYRDTYYFFPRATKKKSESDNRTILWHECESDNHN